MKEIRDKRLWEIYMDTLDSRIRRMKIVLKEVIQDIKGCDVSPRELLFRSIKFRDIIGPENKEFDDEALRPTFRVLILDYLEMREREAREALADMIRQETDLKESADPFSLAIGSHFTCSSCNGVFQLHNAVRHACNFTYTWTTPVPKPEWMTNDYYAVVRESFSSAEQYGQPVWSVEVYRSQFHNVASVIKACGFDIQTATVKDLDKDKGVRLICTSHLEKYKYIPVMNWRAAAYGKTCCLQEKPNLHPNHELASDEFKEAVKESEEKQAAKILAARFLSHIFRCSHCDDCSELRTKMEVVSHLKEKHGIEKATKRDIVDESKRELIITPVYLVSHRCQGRNHALHRLELPSRGNDEGHRIIYWKIK
ncbi:hypothetical protein BDY19DRAFT_458558 [Irpex rosettiformis]|uniref:Uncharacterized protein n=1 Tax=Irpex rosettiformis TaxID=378272 RepID=A0ACB8TSW1_9APHY|nr:hypothetical protein BDY19DRAFT_458558 [Irpex rosettiformis]